MFLVGSTEWKIKTSTKNMYNPEQQTIDDNSETSNHRNETDFQP